MATIGKSIEVQVKTLVSEISERSTEDLSSCVSLAEDLGLDSVLLLELMVSVEGEFNIPAADEWKLHQIRTIGDLCEFVRQRTENLG